MPVLRPKSGAERVPQPAVEVHPNSGIGMRRNTAASNEGGVQIRPFSGIGLTRIGLIARASKIPQSLRPLLLRRTG